MRWSGHVGAALLAYAPLGVAATVFGAGDLAAIGALLAAGLSKLPDVDRDLPGVEHRGITHTLWFALLVGAVLGLAGVTLGLGDGVESAAVVGFFAVATGIAATCSHVAADALTPVAVRPLAPVRTTSYAAGVAPSTDPAANYALLVAGAGALAGALWLASSIGG